MEGDTEGGVNKARLLYNHIWEAVITAWAHRQLSWSTTDPVALGDCTSLPYVGLTAFHNTPMLSHWCAVENFALDFAMVWLVILFECKDNGFH